MSRKVHPSTGVLRSCTINKNEAPRKDRFRNVAQSESRKIRASGSKRERLPENAEKYPDGIDFSNAQVIQESDGSHVLIFGGPSS